jgi:hypothetical protein
VRPSLSSNRKSAGASGVAGIVWIVISVRSVVVPGAFVQTHIATSALVGEPWLRGAQRKDLETHVVVLFVAVSVLALPMLGQSSVVPPLHPVSEDLLNGSA